MAEEWFEDLKMKVDHLFATASDEEICRIFNKANPGCNLKPKERNMKMSLAAALRHRSEIVNEIQLAQARIMERATYIIGHEVYSQYDYDSLYVHLKAMQVNLIKLKVAIDNGNHVEIDGDTVYKLILTRGETKANMDFTQQLRNVIVSTCQPRHHYGHTQEEIPPPKARANVKDLDDQLDTLRRELRKIDNRISDLNGKIQIEYTPES